MSVPDQPNARRGAFFGRRKGHALRARQAALMETLLPRLAVDLAQPAPADLAALFPVPVDDVRLEIGFGGGEHMIAQAAAHPCSGAIGVEPFVNGMAKALAAIAEKQLANIRLHFGDATFLLDWLPPASLAGVDLIYPDPWPKRRHWKRRFVQDRSVAAIARVLRPGGEFRFASDISDYAAWTLAHLGRSRDFVWTAERADDWNLPWRGFSGTRYEAKAKREGRVPCYLVFRKQRIASSE
jgi:tRNA (guanine-N7-)-methyltransferase